MELITPPCYLMYIVHMTGTRSDLKTCWSVDMCAFRYWHFLCMEQLCTMLYFIMSYIYQKEKHTITFCPQFS